MTEFAEVHVTDLTGAALDWAVALTQGYESDRPQGGQLKMKWLGVWIYVVAGQNIHVHPSNRYSPSVDWAQGGPIIQAEQIELSWDGSDGKAFWWKAVHQDIAQFQMGDTHLVAACRAIVAAKLGETVSVPKELLPC